MTEGKPEYWTCPIQKTRYPLSQAECDCCQPPTPRPPDGAPQGRATEETRLVVVISKLKAPRS